MAENSSMTIGRLAKAAGVNVETVRYYQRLRLLAEPKRPYGSIRRYGDNARERIEFIKRAQRLGFTLAEIATLFNLNPRTDRHKAHQLSLKKIEELDARMKDFQAMREALRALIEACEAGDTRLPCPIIEAFRGADA